MPNEVVLVVMEPGIGLVMPNLTTAIQNAVPRRDLDAATAAAFFRSLGGALGAALSGAVLAAHLHGPTAEAGRVFTGVLQIAELPAAQRAIVLDAIAPGSSAPSPSGRNRRARFPDGAFPAGTPRCASPRRSNLGRARS
jgi:hypothetical protein